MEGRKSWFEQPMDPPIFTGNYSEDHVLTFLKKFERRFRDSMTTQGMADYMYQQCFSNGVKLEMADVREDYDRLKKRLLDAYGDPSRIIATERRLLFKIKKPDENDGEAVLTFLDEVLARMNTMVRVVEDHESSYPHLPSVVFADDTLAKIKESLSAQIKMKYESKFRLTWRMKCMKDAGTK